VTPINTPTWVLERNFYFYEVDAAGNQLPYLDRIQLTLGENLADNGGLRQAYQAARLQPDAPRIDGFTAAQRFFLAWAQIRCENVTDNEMRHRTHSDGHSPGRLRVNVVVSNMTEFASAFGCPATAPMARANRCTLW